MGLTFPAHPPVLPPSFVFNILSCCLTRYFALDPAIIFVIVMSLIIWNLVTTKITITKITITNSFIFESINAG